MKKLLISFALLGTMLPLCSCSNFYATLDYSKIENWYKCDYTGTKDVDTIFIYPTVVMEGDEVTSIEENRKGIKETQVFEVQTSVFLDSTNIYMPLYRQMAMNKVEPASPKHICDLFASYQGYKDIEESLDYYFKYFNNDKPYILAGHSQGSAQLFNVLTKYMQNHSQYLSRMVACYALGFGQSKTEIGKYSNLKFATGETDTNCIISYNTFGPEHEGPSSLHDEDSFVINPINWKVDETLATKEENKGSFIHGKHVSGVSDAKINLAKGYLVSTASSEYEVKDADVVFGTHSFHQYDYGFYFENLKQNAAKRIESFLAKKD